VPTYEYECRKCGHAFERFQSMTDEPVKRCPKCRCRVHRVFGGGAGIIFKGSGFYATDYRSPAYSESAKKESGDAGASKEKKDDNKPSKSGSESAKKETGS